MDILAGSVVSSIESAAISIYHSTLMYLNMGPYSRHEGFAGYPVDKQSRGSKSGQGGDDAYHVYQPYLLKTEASSRNQHDNHRWPTSREMTGPHEQTLRKEIVLPCNYPNPALLKGRMYSSI